MKIQETENEIPMQGNITEIKICTATDLEILEKMLTLLTFHGKYFVLFHMKKGQNYRHLKKGT